MNRFPGRALKAARKMMFIEMARHARGFYPFIPLEPAFSRICVTDKCNSRCITCTQWKHNSTNELTTKEIDDLLVQLKRIGVKGVGFGGGEPLLREDLPFFLQRSSDLGFETIAVFTNGLLLEAALARKLLESGANAIVISLDGLEETNDMIRGIRGSFRQVLSALRLLVDLRDKEYPRLDIRIATTLMKQSLNDLVPLTELVDDLGIKINLNLMDTSPVFFNKIDRDSFFVQDQEALDEVLDELHNIRSRNKGIFPHGHTHASFEYMRRYFQDTKRSEIPCVLGHSFVDVGAHGEVYSGCFVLKPVGNIREQPLEEIVYSEVYQKRLRDMFYKRCPGCACAFQANLLNYLPWLKDEIRWKVKTAGNRPLSDTRQPGRAENPRDNVRTKSPRAGARSRSRNSGGKTPGR